MSTNVTQTKAQQQKTVKFVPGEKRYRTLGEAERDRNAGKIEPVAALSEIIADKQFMEDNRGKFLIASAKGGFSKQVEVGENIFNTQTRDIRPFANGIYDRIKYGVEVPIWFSFDEVPIWFSYDAAKIINDAAKDAAKIINDAAKDAAKIINDAAKGSEERLVAFIYNGVTVYVSDRPRLGHDARVVHEVAILKQVTQEQFVELVRDTKRYKLVNAVRDKQTGEVIVQSSN